VDHILKEFNSRRLLPARKLRLPLKQISDRYVNYIVNGKCIVSKNRIGVILFDELIYKDNAQYSTPKDYYCSHGFSKMDFY
jgi:hypothetical protein